MGSGSGTHDLALARAEPITSALDRTSMHLHLPDPPLAEPAAGVVLRPWGSDAADADALASAWDDPAIAATCGVPEVTSVEAAATWIAGDQARRAAGRSLDLVIASQEARTVLGEVGLRNVDRDRGRAEVSWWIAREHRGRGLATVGVRLLVDWALSPAGAGLVQVWARIDPTNVASARVATAAGMSVLGAVAGAEVWARTGVCT
jgi:[ribosomal protein S5]-alanine N-acetyltransferase